jgi:hypothetical protein
MPLQLAGLGEEGQHEADHEGGLEGLAQNDDEGAHG